MKRGLLILIIVTGALATYSQTIWTSYNTGPFGGIVNDIVVTSTGTLIAASQNGGIWRSTDEGANWTKSNSSETIIYDLEINGSTIYASVGGSARLIKSSDDGANFVQVTGLLGLPSILFINLVKVLPNGNILYFYNTTGSTSLYRSTDSGAIFSNIFGFGSSVTDIEIDATGNIYVAPATGGVRVSTNSGSSFGNAVAPLAAPVLDISISGTNIAALTSAGPFLSTNAGTSWASIYGNLTPSSTFSGGLKYTPGGSLFLINTFNNANSIITSADNGVNWSYQNDVFTSYRCLVFNASSIAFMGSGGVGVFKSSSPWTAWTHASKGIKALQPTDAHLIPNGTVLVTATGTTGIFVSQISSDATTLYRMPLSVSSITNFNGLFYGYTPGAAGLVRSTGATGISWTNQNSTTVLNNVISVSGQLVDVSNTTIQTSVNNGVNWTPQSLTGAPVSGTINKIILDVTPGTLYALTNTGLLYKIVTSTTNVSQLSPTGILDIAYADGTLFVLTTTTQIQRSTDGGSSFTNQSIPSSFASNKIWAFDRNNFITRSAVASSATVHTFNQNKLPQWSTRALNDSGAGVSMVDFVYSTVGLGYAAVNNSTLHISNIPLASPKNPENLRIRSNSPSTPAFAYPQSGAFEFYFEDNDPVGSRFVLERSLDNVAWDSVANATHPSGAVWKNHVGLSDFDYADLTQGTQYYYRAKAVNESGQSGYSNVVSAVLSLYCNSTMPAGRSWNAVATAEPGSTPNGAGPFIGTDIPITANGTAADRFFLSQYRFNIVPPSVQGTVNSGLNIQENCGKVSAFYLSGGAFGREGSTWDNVTKTLTVKWRTYSFQIFEATTVYTLNAVDPAPPEPTLTAGVYSSTESLLTWNSVSFATEYVLERSTGGGPLVQLAVLSSNIQLYIDKNLTPNTIYEYKLTAQHNFGPGGSTVTNTFVNSPTNTPTISFASVQLSNSLYRPIETDLNQNLDNQQGASWADLDGDGDDDLLLATFSNPLGIQQQPISVFENQGNSQMKRKEVEGLTNDAVSVMRCIGAMDFNNDGKLDIYANWSGSGNDRIFINQGNWNFTRLLVNEINTTTVRENLAMIDVDKDSFIDFYIATEEASIASLVAQVAGNTLIKNVAGTSVTQVTNDPIVTNPINSKMAAFADYDNDGDQDLYASSDWGQGQLYNNTNGVFTRVSGLIFDFDLLNAVRTISWGDIDNDGDLDLYISADGNLGTGGTRRLYRNNFVNGTFNDFTQEPASPLQTTATGFSSAFGDLDNDGDLDLFTTNPNTIFRNIGDGTFTIPDPVELINNPLLINGGVALADVDADGFLEVFPSKASGVSAASASIPNLLFKPTYAATSARRWLEVKLIGNLSNKAAIGARITVATAALTSPVQLFRSQIREIAGMTGYGAQSSIVQHFGLQNSTTCTVTVRWPSGIVQTLAGVTSNQLITITEDNAGPAITVLSPAHESKAVAFSSVLEITFDETPILVAGKKVSLFLASNLTTPVQAFDVTAGVLSGNKITFTPSASLTPNTLFKVIIEDGAIKDIYNNIGTYATVNWQFTTLDIVAPVFGSPAATFPTEVSKGFSTNTFTASVADNVSVASVILSHRGTGTTDVFTDISGTFNATSNLWEFIVPETLYNTTGLEFYFTAKDPDNNSARHPTANNLQSLFETTPPVVSVGSHPAIIAKGFGSQIFKVIATDNFSIALVKMYYRNVLDGVTYSELSGTADGTVANQYNFTVPESALNGKGIEFFFTASDPTGNSVREPLGTGTITFLFETTAPILTVPTTAPIIAKGFVTRTFSVTASDNFGVASVLMSYRNTKTGTTYAELTGTLSTTIANKYDFSVPEAAFNDDGLEFFFVASDVTGNTIRNPLATDSPSTFKMLLDNQAPSIVPFIPPASVVKANFTVTVKASDNIAVSSVVMNYRGISSKEFIISSTGTKNTSGDYEFAVGSDWFDNMGIEYYFEAADASGNRATNPDITAATNKYHKTFLKFETGSFQLDLIKGSTGASGYQIVSVPLELSNKNIADNFEELGTADKTAFRFLRYHHTPTPGWDEYPGGGLSVLARGEGYFLNSLKAEKITLLSGVAPQIDQANLFQMVLKKGWNQIGNPYTVQIQWSDVIAYNNNPAGVGKLVKYDNGFNTNDASGIIEPYKGGFVQVDNDITVKIPFKGFTTGGRMASIDSDLGHQNWEMPFTLSQQGLSYQIGLIGMNREASVTKDNFDLPSVPRLSEYIEANFDHPEHFMKHFAQDVVPTQDEYTWEFSVASNLAGEIVMRWNNTVFGENNKEIYLMDVDMQQLVNMRDRNLYSFDPKRSRVFKIFFGENLEKKIKPSRVYLHKIYPNPTNGITNISFAIPEQKTNAHTRLEVYDMMGKKISTLVNGNLLPGFYTTEWDTTQSNVTDGLYVCRLLVNGDSGEDVLSEKIIVKK